MLLIFVLINVLEICVSVVVGVVLLRSWFEWVVNSWLVMCLGWVKVVWMVFLNDVLFGFLVIVLLGVVRIVCLVIVL